MNKKIKKIFTNFKVLSFLIVLILAVVAIHPNPYKKGVAIRNVISNSSANLAGVNSPKPGTAPMSREIIASINNKAIRNVVEYSKVLENLRPNTTIQLRTNRNTYRLMIKEKGEDIGLRVYDAPQTNIRKGLDLQGGTRVLLQSEEKITESDMQNLISVMGERLNVYGLSDLVIRGAGDLSGNQYILVEIAGASEEEITGLLEKQGKFEAKIGNETVFRGGEDITYVCRSADCAGISPFEGCSQSSGQWLCRFRFSISLSAEAAERQAGLTKDLEVVMEDKQQYLSEKLILFMDDKQVDELRIGAELKGRAETNIQISGSGAGISQQEAIINSMQNMKRLQTILITGSLPFKLNIVKTDSVSPVLGEEFVKNALFAGLLAILVVAVIVFARYRELRISIPMLISSVSEVVILLGVASLTGWNLDLAAIAGIIISVGTGVDHKIVITDETLRGEAKKIFNWKEKIKGAFFIIIGAYLTTAVAMVPLIFAGAGMLKGFAITTLIGITISLFTAKTAYADIIEIIIKE